MKEREKRSTVQLLVSKSTAMHFTYWEVTVGQTNTGTGCMAKCLEQLET